MHVIRHDNPFTSLVAIQIKTIKGIRYNFRKSRVLQPTLADSIVQPPIDLVRKKVMKSNGQIGILRQRILLEKRLPFPF